jgi:hypothetical protein
VPVRVDVEVGHDERLAVVAGQVEDGLAVAQQVRGEVDEGADPPAPPLGGLAGGDAAAAVGDDDGRLGRGVDRGVDALGVVVERHVGRRRVVAAVAGQLDGLDVMAEGAQARHDLVPAPCAVPGTVDENEGAHAGTTPGRRRA